MMFRPGARPVHTKYSPSTLANAGRKALASGDVTLLANVTPSVERWMVKPASLLELSTHFRLIWLVEPAVAVRLLGAAGALIFVVAWATLDQAELPAEFVARTRK